MGNDLPTDQELDQLQWTTLLDGPGSTLGTAQVQRALQRLTADSISFVTLGEAAEAVGEYDTVLELEADGGWSWKPVSPGPQPGEENMVGSRPRGCRRERRF